MPRTTTMEYTSCSVAESADKQREGWQVYATCVHAGVVRLYLQRVRPLVSVVIPDEEAHG